MDTYTLSFKNFRSMEEATVEVAPLTVVYGPNGSGKSSLIYGLLTLRNFLTNPNQNIPSLFSYSYMALGGLQEVIHRHSMEKSISLSIGVSSPEELSSRFTLTLDGSGGAADITFERASIHGDQRVATWPVSLSLKIAIPYPGNQQVDHKVDLNFGDSPQTGAGNQGQAPVPGTVRWNGTTVSTQSAAESASQLDVLRRVTERANLPMEIARQSGFVPLRRGFSRPAYGLSAVTATLGVEDEVASLLASPNERFQQYEISGFVERIAGRRILTQAQIGTSTFTIDSIPTGMGVPASIVNEGFGINQLLYMLTICLHSPFKIVAIEEPEIHLHPSMVRELALAMAEIAMTRNRRLIVSTHSEAFVVALLSQIAAGKISVEDVSFILAENPEGSTSLTPQTATPKGQIEGGLQAFMASEAEDLMAFLQLSEE